MCMHKINQSSNSCWKMMNSLKNTLTRDLKSQFEVNSFTFNAKHGEKDFNSEVREQFGQETICNHISAIKENYRAMLVHT